MLRIFPFDKTGVSEALAQFEENHDQLNTGNYSHNQHFQTHRKLEYLNFLSLF